MILGGTDPSGWDAAHKNTHGVPNIIVVPKKGHIAFYFSNREISSVVVNAFKAFDKPKK